MYNRRRYADERCWYIGAAGQSLEKDRTDEVQRLADWYYMQNWMQCYFAYLIAFFWHQDGAIPEIAFIIRKSARSLYTLTVRNRLWSFWERYTMEAMSDSKGFIVALRMSERERDLCKCLDKARYRSTRTDGRR